MSQDPAKISGQSESSVDREIFGDEQFAGLTRVPRLELRPGDIVGKCRIIRELGSGGMGTVYLCRHTRLDIDVALKVLPPLIARERPEVARRFIREAQLAARIRHPNVVLVMDADFDEKTGLYYIIFEFVSGGSLADLLDRRRMTVGETISVILDVANALVVAAQHGIVHRDVKPDNIMLDERGTAKLADLGLARQAMAEAQSRVTQDGAAIGTPSYMSPDQIKDALNADAQDDIYSLGATLYECLTGNPPFPSSTAVNALSNALFSPTPDPRERNKDVSPELSAICRKMMAKVKAERYRTAEEVVVELEAQVAQLRGATEGLSSRESLQLSAQEAQRHALELNRKTKYQKTTTEQERLYAPSPWWVTYQREILSTLGAAALVLIVLSVISWGTSIPTPDNPDQPAQPISTEPTLPTIPPARMVAHHPPPPLVQPILPGAPNTALEPGSAPRPPGEDAPPSASTAPSDGGNEEGATETPPPAETALTPKPALPTEVTAPPSPSTPTEVRSPDPAEVEPGVSVVRSSDIPVIEQGTALPTVESQDDAHRPVSAFRALQLARKELKPEVSQQLIEITSDRRDNTLTPWKWRFLFYDPSAEKNGRTVTVEGMVVTDREEGFSEGFADLNRFRFVSYKSKEVMPMDNVMVDSSHALELAQGIPELEGALISSTDFRLTDKKKPEPVWRIRLFGPRSEADNSEVFLGEVEVSAKTGVVVDQSLKRDRILKLNETVEELPPPANIETPPPANP